MIVIERTVDISKPIQTETLRGNEFKLEANAHTFRISVANNGAAVALTGSVSASMLLADGSGLTLGGSLDNGVAVLTLPQAAYGVPGRFMLAIYSVQAGATEAETVKTCIYACVGAVINTYGEQQYDPGNLIPDAETLAAYIEACQQATADAQAAASIATEHFPATGKLQAGIGTQATENGAVATGVGTTASGRASHAEGQLTTADGQVAHAEGYGTFASGDYSHAEGFGTKASGDHQHAVGKYNVEDTNDTYLEIAGNGTGDAARSNARTLDWNGNETLAGDLTVNKGGAGEMVLGQEVSSLKSAFSDTTGMIVYTKTIGGYNSDDGKTYLTANNRIRIDEYIGIDDVVSASQPSGYWLYYFVFDASYNMIYKSSEWRQSTAPLLFSNIKSQRPTAAYIHLMMRAASNGQLYEADKDKLVITQTTIKDDLSALETEMQTEFASVDNNITAVKASADTQHGMSVSMMTQMFRYNCNTVAADEAGVFGIGGITNAGYPNDSITTQIRSKETNLRNITEFLRCSLSDDWKFDFVFYQSGTPLGIVLYDYIGKSMIEETNDILICPQMLAYTAGYTTATKYRLRIKKGDGTAEMTETDVATVTAGFVFTPYGKEYKYENYFPHVDRRLVFLAPVQTQNMANVDGYIWQSVGAEDNHSVFRPIYIFNPSILTGKETYDGTSEAVRIVRHNLGHAGVLDYSDRLDLGISYGEFDGSLHIIFIKNMANKQEIDALNDPDIIKIEIASDTYTPFFGGSYNTIMMISGNTISTYLLGTGTNDLSADGVGTFISGCADDEFNGTMRLIETASFEAMTERTQQQSKLINGAIYMLTGTKDNIIYKYLYAGPGGGWVKREKYICHNYNELGKEVTEEPEGLCTIDGTVYYSAWYNYAPTHFSLYKLS
jgi:hypothetical protein